MTDPRHARVKELFLAACEEPALRRPMFLDRLCVQEPELRREVESLLAFHDVAPRDPASSRESSQDPAVSRPAPRDSVRDPGTDAPTTEPLAASRSAGPQGVARKLGALFRRLRSGLLLAIRRPTKAAVAGASRPQTAAPSPGGLTPGRILLHYRIVEKLGEGGMGKVFVAEDTKLRRRVALKVLPMDTELDGLRLKRFRHEARAVAALTHPNIVTLYSVEECDGLHFLTMELVKGKSLDDFTPPEGLVLSQIIPIAESLAKALAAAHEQGIVHRDLKPSNIMVQADGSAKVLDFGVAKRWNESLADDRKSGPLTQRGSLIGTVPYMSPEQVQAKPIDPRSDLFSLGIVLYEMATGQRPFQGETPAEVISALLRDHPRPLSDLRPSLPPSLGLITHRCLEKAPERRYPTSTDLLTDLGVLKERMESPTADSSASPPVSIRPIPTTEEEPSPGRPLVGRDVELSQLRSSLDRAVGKGERQVVFVTGEAGIGKTALLEAFLAPAEKEPDLLVARGQCQELYGSAEAYSPVLEVLDRLARRDRHRLLPILAHRAPTWLVHLPGLLSDTELERARSRAAGSTPERMLREIANALEAASDAIPLAIVLEDLHWSDASTLDVISTLARRCEPARLLVIASFRPPETLVKGRLLQKLQEDLKLHELCTELPLQALRAEAVTQYLAHRLDSAQIAPPLTELVLRLTAGNPLFFVNTIEVLLDRGHVVESNGQWGLELPAGDEGQVEVPDSLDRMIQAQVEALQQQEQEVLQVASVAGVEFSTTEVAAALDRQTEEVEELCANMARRRQFLEIRREEVSPDGTIAECYGFVHALYQKALYGRLARTKRVRLHGRIGESLEAKWNDQLDEIAPRLAVHFDNARDARRALKYYGLAAHKGFRRIAPREAAEQLRKALAVLETLPDDEDRDRQELELQMALGQAHTLARGSAPSDVERPFLRAQELCQRLGDRQLLFSIVQGVWISYIARGDLQGALELAQQLVALAQEQEDPVLRADAHHAAAVVQFFLGEPRFAREHLEEATVVGLNQLGTSPEVSIFAAESSLGLSALVLWSLGYADQALKRNQECHALQEALQAKRGQPSPSLGLTLLYSVWLHTLLRQPEKARQCSEELLELPDQQATVFKEAAKIVLGWATAQLLQDSRPGGARSPTANASAEVDEVLRDIEGALDKYRAPGRQIGQTLYLSLLASVYASRGQIAAAIETLEQAFAAVANTGERCCESELYRMRGELLLADHAGDSSSTTEARIREAESSLRRALDLARRREVKSLELRAATSLARLWRAQGKGGPARELLAEVYDWFSEGFETADLQEAKALLDALTQSRERP